MYWPANGAIRMSRSATSLLMLPLVLGGCFLTPTRDKVDLEVLLKEVHVRVASGDPTPIDFVARRFGGPEKQSLPTGEFEHDSIRISAVVLSWMVNFQITNDTGDSIGILGDQSLYEDLDGRVHRGLRISLFSANATATPSIPAGQWAGFSCRPSEFSHSAQTIFPVLPVDPSPREVAEFCARIGQPLRVVLALRSRGTTREYHMRWIVNDIVVNTFRGPERWLRQRPWGECPPQDVLPGGEVPDSVSP